MSLETKLIKEVVTRLNSSIQALDRAHVTVAKDMYWARYVVKWNLTTYNSWHGFCKACISMHRITVSHYVTVGAKIDKFNYTDAQCAAMIDKLNWSRFKFGLMNQKTKISIKNFIKKYESWTCQSSGKYSPDTERAYTFSLPLEVADKLDSYLLQFGMSVIPGRTSGRTRTGVRHAMIKLIDTQLD